MTRLGPSVDGAAATLLLIATGVLVLSFGSLTTTQTSVPVAGDGIPSGGVTSGGGSTTGSTTGKNTSTTGGSTGASSGATGGGAGRPLPAGIACAAGKNGGKTDRGVTANSISLGATVVSSGIGASFLGPVRVGMQAVKDSVNRSGGICGRQLSLKLVDDGWDAQRGQSYIHSLVEGDKVFGLAVNPSSEGLRLASNEGYFAKTRTPVVGTDGMLNDQYVDPWVWPVAASTVSTMHIIAKEAYEQKRARNFSIIFDSHYHFGVEGAFAFNAAVKRLTGKDIPGYFNPDSGASCNGRFCAIEAGRASYATDNKAFNDKCFPQPASEQNPDCDFVALLLEPNEALTFLNGGFSRSFVSGMGLAQTLFSRSFATACKATCNGATVWTGYNPPIEGLARTPGVMRYVNDIRSVDPSADIYNQFLEGGYSGMRLLVEALTRTGPNLTRDGIKATLDSMKYDNGLSTPLEWSPGNHYANSAMRGFSISYSGGFNGFKSIGGWVEDPWLGQDTPKRAG